MSMEIQVNPYLVALSILVAIFASYVALNLAHNVMQTKGRVQALWLVCGALAMGIGIWSMHFVGMLAYEMPGMAMAYDIPLMILSVIVAVGSSALAFYIVSRPVVPPAALAAGGIAMAVAISGMHYIGMFSMRMAASIHWDVFLIVVSVLIALVASFGALFILIRLRNRMDRWGQLLMASTVMGFAVSGMHYTGMYAATFVHDDSLKIENQNLIVSDTLTIAVIGTTLFILALALASSLSHRILHRRTRGAAEILVRTEERFRRLVEAVKEYAIIMLDPNGYITSWNLGAERIYGYADHEVVGRHVSMFYPKIDGDGPNAAEELRTAAEIGYFEGESQRLRKNGNLYWASVVIAPLYDQDGQFTGFSKITRDITPRKESEKRLRELNEELEARVKARTRALAQHENQLRTIANAIPVLIAQLDANERFTFANDAFCKWFLRELDQVIGRTFREILGEDRYPANEPYVKKVLAGENVIYERESHSGDLTAILNITFVPEFDEQGAVTGFIVLATDITKHKEIETELKQAKEAAEEANSTKSAFLANMSHEIRTPLGAILGFSELMLTGEMNAAERFNCVEVIKRNGRLLSNIINDILDLSKVEAGRLEIERVVVPFGEVMKEISSGLSLEAAEKGIELKVTSEGVIPSQIKTDPLRLRQILLNIVGNAIKFTKRGAVHVRVKMLPTAEAPKLAFIIKDTGEGIKPEQVKRLFTPFMQADVSTTRRFGGTGLGLVLSKKLANALGGDVNLTETIPGQGSTFTITIDPGVADQILFQSKESPVSKVPILIRDIRLERLRVLLVEDSIDNQALVRKLLELAGASVATANNGLEGVQMALSDQYNLVLMDLQMPIMDGYEATKSLRDAGFKKPIIALTAHAMKEERQRALQSGFNEHLTKPIDHKVLLRTLAEYAALEAQLRRESDNTSDVPAPL